MKPDKLIQRCPGLVGVDLPIGQRSPGKVIVEPGRIEDAMKWLKRRFHVNKNLELSTDVGLCVEVIPKVRRKQSGNGLRVQVSFEKTKQFEFNFAT